MKAVPARPVEVLREPGDAGEHLQRGEVEVGAFALPGVDDPVDLVDVCGHPAIIEARERWGASRTARDAGSGRVSWQT